MHHRVTFSASTRDYINMTMSMTLKETTKQLESLGNEKTRAHNTKNGAGDNQFGVPRGDLRVLAKKIKINHELALALWKTGNLDAQLLVTRF